MEPVGGSLRLLVLVAMLHVSPKAEMMNRGSVFTGDGSCKSKLLRRLDVVLDRIWQTRRKAPRHSICFWSDAQHGSFMREQVSGSPWPRRRRRLFEKEDGGSLESAECRRLDKRSIVADLVVRRDRVT